MGGCQEFLSSVLPETGLYCITTISKAAGKAKAYAKNREFSDLRTASEYALYNAHNTNVYFALSSYAYDNSGRFQRTAVNARAQKALWLDVDCGHEGEEPIYGDKASALKALVEFLKATKLPAPTIVDSGNGYHLYWTMTRSVPTAMWKRMATLLRKTCGAHGFLADHHRTCDAASILRVPGSFNHKHGELEVRVVNNGKPSTPEDLARVLVSVQGNQVTPSTTTFNTQKHSPYIVEGLSFSSEFTTIPKDTPPRNAEKMIIKCRQIREMGTSKYPAWQRAARTLLHTVGGELAIWKLSQYKTDSFDHDSCQTLINSLKSDMSIGPCTCEGFMSVAPHKCEGCPFKGKVKTPWSLAEVAVPKTVEMPKANIETADFSQGEINLGGATETAHYIPYSDETYKVIPGQGVFKTVTDEDGVPHAIKLTENEIYIHTLCIDTTQGSVPKRTYIMRKVVPGCAPVDIPFAIEDALGTQKIEMWTAQCGLLPPPKTKRDFFSFMNTYLAAIQNKLPEVYVRNHFGWAKCVDKVTGDSYEGFIVGQKMYSRHGESQVRLDDRAASVATKLGERGSLEEWKKVPNLYGTLNQKFAQLLMCASFGAPLMRCGRGTATNVAFSSWEPEGGRGKTSLLKAMASVWGDPQQMLMGRTDTHAARFQQYAVYRNLPILIDELTGISDEDTASLLYDIVNGREKARSTAAGTGLAQSGHWDTITMFTANQSMYEALRSYRVQSSATCMRLIESVCDFKDYTNTEYAHVINDAMVAARNNYGVAGPKFIEFIVNNPKLLDVVGDYAEKFATKYAESSDERFWMYGIAIPLIAGRIARQLGLLNYDMDALQDYCINELLPELRSKVKINKPTGSNLLMDFLNDSLADTLIVRAKNRKEFKKLNDEQKIEPNTYSFGNIGTGNLDPYVVQIPTRKLLIRRELDTETVYISSRALTDWCKARVISLDNMLQELQQHGYAAYGLKTKRYILAKDVPSLPSGSQTVYCFRVERGEQNEN